MAYKGINKAIIIGNLGKDPELREFDKGSLCTFSVATSESWKDKSSGHKEERTEWHKIVCYDPISKIASRFLKKGSQVYIEGPIKTRKWEKDGESRYTTEIIAKSIQILSSKNQGQNVRISNSSDNNLDEDFGF